MPRNDIKRYSKNLTTNDLKNYKWAIVLYCQVKLVNKDGTITEYWSSQDDVNFIDFVQHYANALIKNKWALVGKYLYLSNLDDALWFKMRYSDKIKKILPILNGEIIQEHNS